MKPDVDGNEIVGGSREGGRHGFQLRLGGDELLPSFVKLGTQEVDPNGARSLSRLDPVEELRGFRFPPKAQEETGPRKEPVRARVPGEEGQGPLSVAQAGQEPRSPLAPLERFRQGPRRIDAGRRCPRVLHPSRRSVDLGGEERLSEIRSRRGGPREEGGDLLRTARADRFAEAEARLFDVGLPRPGRRGVRGGGEKVPLPRLRGAPGPRPAPPS
ncbi:MAG: hypothetical protein IPN83_04970 [Holophagales bacterium]|nr:hypothetical protein [Holophagales bacterium]